MDNNKIKVSLVVLFLPVLSASFIAASQPPTNNTAIQPMAGFGSSIVFSLTGSVYPRGHLELSLSIGNPPKSFTFDIDSGSDLTWVQCDANCKGCTLPIDELYKPGQAFVPNKDPLCASIGNPVGKDPNEKCDFNIRYVGGTTNGYLVRDGFALQLVKGTTSRTSLTFGCGNEIIVNDPENPIQTAGILAFGKSVASIPSQLRAAGVAQNVIGHCLSAKGGGFFFIGNDPVPSSGVTWTPMLKTTLAQYYASGPADLFFDGKATDIRSLDLIFDCGSTYTYFPSAIYGAILSLLNNDLTGKPLGRIPYEQDETLPLCWKGRKPFKSLSDVRSYFKTFTLSFTSTQNAELQLPPETYLVISEHGNACLGILNGTTVGIDYNVLGDISLLDKTVVYDNERQRIGWTSGNCFPPTP